MQHNVDDVNLLITEYLSDHDSIQWMKVNRNINTQIANRYALKRHLHVDAMPVSCRFIINKVIV